MSFSTTKRNGNRKTKNKNKNRKRERAKDREKEREKENIMIYQDIRQELQCKYGEINKLKEKYCKLESSMMSDEIIKQRAIKQCEKYKLMYNETEKINEKLQEEIYKFEAKNDKIDSLELYLKNLSSENNLLRQQINKLTKNALLADELETHRISKMQLNFDKEINENKENKEMIKKLSLSLNQEIGKNTENESIINKLNEKLQTLQLKMKLFQDKSGVNLNDLECALELIEKSKRMSTDNKNLNFLNRIEIDKCNDPIILKGKIDELQIKNHDLIIECTQNQNLLETQINLNKKLEKDYHDLENEYIEMKNNLNNIKTEIYRLRSNNNNNNNDDIAMFNKSDIENINYSTTENLIIFNISYAELNPTYFQSQSSSILSMIIIDFYEFDSIFSNIFAGLHPKYDIFCQYKVNIDQFFLNFIQNKFIFIDFVIKTDKNKLKIIANNKISLKNLLITPDSCIQNEIELITNDEHKQCVGKLSFMAKMLRSVDL